MSSSPQLARNPEPSLQSADTPDLNLIATPDPSSETLQPTVREEVSATTVPTRKPLPAAVALIGVASLGSAIAYLLPARNDHHENNQAPSAPVRAVYPDPSEVSLSGNRAGRNIEITWNTSAPMFASARIAILSITDGNLKKEITLTAAQLQAQKLVYTPVTDRVEAVLEVFSSDRKSTRQSVTFVLPPAEIARPDAVIRTEPVHETRTAEGADEQVRARTFIPPSSAKGAVPERVVVLDPPPLLETAQNRLIPSFQTPVPGIVGPPIPADALILSKSPDATAIKPPRPTREVRPTLPPALEAMLSRTTEVEVRIRVDESGKVVQTEPLAGAGRLNQYLGSAAAAAAKMWRFEPAQRGDQKVAATMVLRFTFQRSR